MPEHQIPAEVATDLAPLVADFYDEAPAAVRVHILRAMLGPVGPLALVAIAAGAFARLLPAKPSQALVVTPDIARSIGPAQVQELARYVAQKSPEVLTRLPDMVGSPQVWMATVSGVLLMVALKALNRPPR